jgi:acyl-CoA synthetase (AMP-forming)/AMP-acid ligase II
LRGILTGGSAIDAALIQGFELRFGVPVRTVYGLTETASISTCEYLDPSPRSYGSSGRPLDICRVRVHSERDGLQAPDALVPFQKGEILISGSNVFESYLGDPELTLERKVDGWVRTGDVGYFDKYGNLFVVDRLDSMLIVGGENVYPAEVEKLCALLPGAAQIVLVGVDDSIWGKELVLVYKPERGTTPSVSSWRRILEEQIAAIKIPRRYVSIQELGLTDFPRKENGKLDRRSVSALVAGSGASPSNA